MTLRALIFDVDGTLAETEELHRAAFNAAFRAAGLRWHWSRDAYGALLTTTGGKERIRRYITETGAGEVDVAALHAEKTAHYTALVAKGALELRPGIRALMAMGRAAGVRLAVATTTSRLNVEALCHACFNAPAEAIFDVLACGDEVAAKKPAPDIYLLALDRLGLPADAALAFEDTPMGVASAQGAGMRVVASPGVYSQDADLSRAERRVECFSDLIDGGLAALQARRSPVNGSSARLSGNTTRSA
ncbi:HAD-IA family hydrolase [Rhodobacter sp. NTK016B]|uniref:HAD-IA family hydrolase n=1 Tax=Rhodobacter sp. NTK016B TaxID=2759676 RepID=UPI001A8F3E99|nr:HAD-IA family hydrolase [Rhodobacter sp. NTK016B]MBN8293979.1 HAD-IA family hydrolase [Rhodobacter sp. NTK016B]